MAWENPVTTWGQAGKTVPGAGDFNRIEGNIQHLRTELDEHVEDNLPHITADGNYRYGFNVTTAGELQFVYEEVVE